MIINGYLAAHRFSFGMLDDAKVAQIILHMVFHILACTCDTFTWTNNTSYDIIWTYHITHMTTLEDIFIFSYFRRRMKKFSFVLR